MVNNRILKADRRAMRATKPSARGEVTVALSEDDWHYIIGKLRKAIEPGCYEKSYCQLLDVIPKIEKQLETKSGMA